MTGLLTLDNTAKHTCTTDKKHWLLYTQMVTNVQVHFFVLKEGITTENQFFKTINHVLSLTDIQVHC